MRNLLKYFLAAAVICSATLAFAFEVHKSSHSSKRSSRLRVTKVSQVDASQIDGAVEGPALFSQGVGDAIQPMPDPVATGTPVAEPGAQPVPVQQAAVPLYQHVRYRDERNIAPCAIPQIVMVKDPCPPPCDPCNRCATPPVQCVAVEICVPPCSECPPKVTCKRGGAYVKYDYGKYRVEIRSKKGVVTVDYDA